MPLLFFRDDGDVDDDGEGAIEEEGGGGGQGDVEQEVLGVDDVLILMMKKSFCFR